MFSCQVQTVSHITLPQSSQSQTQVRLSLWWLDDVVSSSKSPYYPNSFPLPCLSFNNNMLPTSTSRHGTTTHNPSSEPWAHVTKKCSFPCKTLNLELVGKDLISWRERRKRIQNVLWFTTFLVYQLFLFSSMHSIHLKLTRKYHPSVKMD